MTTGWARTALWLLLANRLCSHVARGTLDTQVVDVPEEAVAPSDKAGGGVFEVAIADSEGDSSFEEPPRQLQQGGTLLPLCNYKRTFSSATLSRGFWFTAPTDFCIVAVSAPNELDEDVQNVQVIVRDTRPPKFPNATSGDSAFYAGGADANQILATSPIDVLEGQFVGLLGTAGSKQMRNSYCSVDRYVSDLGGFSVTLQRFLTQQNIFNAPAKDYSIESVTISRVHMYYTMGACGSASGSPSETPTSHPSTLVCLETCGDCSFESAQGGCECRGCQDLICNLDSYCCDTRWDGVCADAALRECDCGVSSRPSAAPSESCPALTCGNCNAVRTEAVGCGCPECEAVVCGTDNSCCTASWGDQCVDLANQFCTECPEPSEAPSDMPSVSEWPSNLPSLMPSTLPSQQPSFLPSQQPSSQPTVQPSAMPVIPPSAVPSQSPSTFPTPFPTAEPTQCEGTCLDAMGSGCGFCYFPQRRGGCRTCPECEALVCGTVEGAICCSSVWDDACALLAKQVCQCCLIEPTAAPSATPSASPSALPTPFDPTKPRPFRDCPEEAPGHDDASGYGMCLDLIVPPEDAPFFLKARQVWTRSIAGDLPNVATANLGTRDACNAFPAPHIDDIYFCGKYEPRDGPFNTLAWAGPRFLRSRNGGQAWLPVTGIMGFDTADIDFLKAQGNFEEVIVHEMGHVLGVGTLWRSLGVTGSIANGCPYNAPIATQMWQSHGCPGVVPTEQDGGGGTRCGHWDEVCLDHEIMTGWIDSGTHNTFSNITLGTMEDMGYDIVYDFAEPYTPPAACCPAGGGGARNLLRHSSTRRPTVEERRVQAAAEQHARDIGLQMLADNKKAMEGVEVPEGLLYVGDKVITVLVADENGGVVAQTVWADDSDDE